MHKLHPKLLGVVAILLTITARFASANLITNPGFETGDFTGWTETPAASGSAYFTDSIVKHSGNFSAEFVAGSSDLDAISQTFATTAGVLYDLTFWLAVDNSGHNPSNEFRVTFGNVIVQDLINAPDFTFTQFNFAVLATGSSMTLEFAARNGSGHSWLDDVSVEAHINNGTGVPDTASSALLLGAAFLGLIFLQPRFAARVT